MEQNEKWLNWAVELQSLAQAGLFYTKDPFDKERYARIREITAEMLSAKTGVSVEKVKDIFCTDTGYQTPKLDTRSAIFNDRGQILLVQENDGRWSLPGGWVDVNVSVTENAAKEVLEEAGLQVKVDRVIAIQDREKHNKPIYAYKVCKIFLHCTVLSGAFQENIETVGSAYFDRTALPPLSEEKNNWEQVEMCFDAHAARHWETPVD